ncbi:filamentous hemagglutinin N-terminal domain-containing protein [Aliarcobacter butzleri]|uniref:beta strand repeat-containing protein n=1 Tax=Aliarcobacter butzleri TaxID=28197 RepID=UPI001EDE9DC3|nr:GLUG motif-containing protein [Aliarcobacter butzleri]MCG3703495.1 filamentous hemagglutinin N-terminal domain-containing protein [Aliarcobacter butzleri]
MYYKNRFCIVKYSVISLVVASNLYGAPTGGTVVSGNATINQNGNTTNINQSSNKAIINWQDFSIKSNETVNFNQPNVNSITLNRVIGNEKSIIDGALNANGQVWLINSNGVLFGKNAKVNTAGIVASTKDISNEDFNNGNYNFKGNSNASIVNEGEIKSLTNTHATFIANSVTNKGKIEVHKGTINLVGASDVTLTLNENQNISLKVNKGVLDALVDNQNLIVANGGQIYLTTNAKNELLKGVVNHSGIIEANSIDDLQSEVILFAHGGTTNVDGSIIAKNSFVETSGEKLNVTSNTKVVAKDWLLDPTNISIESTGGNDLTGDSVSATAIQNNLETTNVHLQATNNITVNHNITWSTDKQLKLQADSINVNATINNTNSTNGGVYFLAANTTDKVVFDTNGKVIVNNVYQLQWINRALNGKYELGSNIDAGVTKTDIAKWGTTGFNPIGIYSSYSGTFDGKGFTISNLYIHRLTQNYVGLFGVTNNATIKNIGLKDVDIRGIYYIGGLVGFNENGTISNSYATGNVNGYSEIGGLVGKNGGTISNSYTFGTVAGNNATGGLVGYNDGTISNSYSSGSATGQSAVGGLVGLSYGTISNSFYDKETNTASMNDSSYGKTKTEILAAFNGTIGWITSGAEVEGYGKDSIELPQLKTFYKPTSTLFEAGYGTTLNPYKITNWTQLQNINNSNILTQNYYFNLLNNLSSSTSDYTNLASNTANGGLGWNPIGNNTNQFNGTFDGKGFTISNLYINRPTQDYVGLFGFESSTSSIRNLGLVNATVTGKDYVGGLVGTKYGLIENSYVAGTISGNSTVGGLVGDNNARIENSYATGEVRGNEKVGGLVGQNNGVNIINSYASGTVTRLSGSNTNFGGLLGYANFGTITNSFYDKEANTASMNDSSYGKTKSEILISFSSKTGWGTTGAGASVEGYETVLLPYLIGVTKDEDKSKSILFSGGFGTSANPYTITNWTQLQNINNSNILTSEYYFNLLNNLSSSTSDYTNLASNTANGGLGWNPIGDNTNRFIGIFDGKGFTISNLYINRPSQNNVGLFGYINRLATIKNIGLKDVNITGKNYTGALLGDNSYGTITNSYATGNVTGNENVGALLGDNSYGTITNSYATGNVTGKTQVGGLVGYNDGTISNSYATGSVNGDYSIGGLVGFNFDGIISNSYATGSVVGTDFVGGLNGSNYGTISNSYATGSVNGNSEVGGFVGYNRYGTITNSYATGSVTGTIKVGGLMGINDYGTITNSYATGTANGNDNVGGLVGLNYDGTIINSYASGTANGNTNVGGLVGLNIFGGGTISNSFYDKTKNPNSNVLGIGKTTAELEDINTFKNAGWSITADNSLAKGTPILKNGYWVIYVAPTPTPTDNNQKPKVDEQVQRVVASIEPSTNSNSNSSSNQSLPNSLNSNIRTLSFNGVDETRVINGGVKMPENIANEEDIIK